MSDSELFPTIASLFSGAGGMDLGFKNAGFNIVWANDNDPDSVATYNNNIGQHCVLGDIREIDLEQIPDVDGIVGGFPCQGFSVANTARTVDDKRNHLYRSFVKSLKIKQPKFFLAENVKGILSLGGGLVFEKILRDFEGSGYKCRVAVVNAADYGVPQNRIRVFIFGVRRDLDLADLDWPPPPTHKGAHQTVGQALAGIPDPDSRHNLKNHDYSKFKVKLNGYISNRPVHENRPSPTITARGDNRGGAMIIPHPSNLRRMSCREVALIQSFPINFVFAGQMTSVYKQIGNAVPPKLAEALAHQIRRGLKNS